VVEVAISRADFCRRFDWGLESNLLRAQRRQPRTSGRVDQISAGLPSRLGKRRRVPEVRRRAPLDSGGLRRVGHERV